MPWCWAKTSCERIPWQFFFVAKLGFRREIWMSATGISPTFEFELGTAFVPRNARDKIPDGPSQDKLHASTEATKTSKWKAGGWLSLLSCYSRAPGVQKRLWRNYFVILAAITNATTLPTGFPEIFDLLLKLFHLFLFTPMLLEHVRLLAGMDWHDKRPSPTNSTQNSNLHILSGNLGEPWPKAKTPRRCFGMSLGGLLYASYIQNRSVSLSLPCPNTYALCYAGSTGSTIIYTHLFRGNQITFFCRLMVYISGNCLYIEKNILNLLVPIL